jgi:hypothetical protein
MVGGQGAEHLGRHATTSTTTRLTGASNLSRHDLRHAFDTPLLRIENEERAYLFTETLHEIRRTVYVSERRSPVPERLTGNDI